MSSASLKITEIFHSLQGEARYAGHPTVFVRLTGCPLRCGYCDSEYAFYGGERMTLEHIVQNVGSFGASYVCVTGGEPLAQPDCLLLLKHLADKGYHVSLETSGAMDIAAVDKRVSIVMDLKTPASGEAGRNRYENLALLEPKDQIKFVLCDQGDYQWAKFQLDQHKLKECVDDIWFSPSFGELDPADLARWILDDRLPVRLQLQLHKQLWGDRPGV